MIFNIFSKRQIQLKYLGGKVGLDYLLEITRPLVFADMISGIKEDNVLSPNQL